MLKTSSEELPEDEESDDAHFNPQDQPISAQQALIEQQQKKKNKRKRNKKKTKKDDGAANVQENRFVLLES